MTISVYRSDLAWMLSAVIPHCHRVKSVHLAKVGLTERADHLYAYALDGYSAVVARSPLLRGHGEAFDVRLPARPSIGANDEANDLLRAIRPGTVAERDQEVELLANDRELHVALPDQDGTVYANMKEGPTLTSVLQLIGAVSLMPDDRRDLTYNPVLLGKLATAQRHNADRLTFFPKRNDKGRVGIMAFTIGSEFAGICSGMTDEHQDKGEDVLASFLQMEEVDAA